MGREELDEDEESEETDAAAKGAAQVEVALVWLKVMLARRLGGPAALSAGDSDALRSSGERLRADWGESGA